MPTKHKYSTTWISPITNSKREQCQICGNLRWTNGETGEIKEWFPKTITYRRPCGEPKKAQPET